MAITLTFSQALDNAIFAMGSQDENKEMIKMGCKLITKWRKDLKHLAESMKTDMFWIGDYEPKELSEFARLKYQILEVKRGIKAYERAIARSDLELSLYKHVIYLLDDIKDTHMVSLDDDGIHVVRQ